MKATKYTPRAWTAQQDCRGADNRGVITAGPMAWGIYGATRLAILTEPQPWLTAEEIEANARLMAAAPEMLEALELAAALIKTARGRFPKSIRHGEKFQLETTCAAIGKAIHKATEAKP